MLKLIHQITQLALEIAGILLVAVGLAVQVGWWFGSGPGLIVCGVTVLGAAYLAERRLHPPKPKPVDDKPVVIARTWWRLAWLEGPARKEIVARKYRRLAWLRNPQDQ